MVSCENMVKKRGLSRVIYENISSIMVEGSNG